jgi:thymidine kinase
MISTAHIIIGPMFAGKTTYLINKVNELVVSGVSLNEMLLFNHSSDSRYDTGKICSHDGSKLECHTQQYLNSLDFNILCNNNYSRIKYIFIDEAQFFPDLFDTIVKILKKTKQITIFIFGLDGDYQQQPFAQSRILELIPYCSSITKLLAKCTICKNNAPFTRRISNSTEQILVGGSNEYQPVCIDHL